MEPKKYTLVGFAAYSLFLAIIIPTPARGYCPYPSNEEQTNQRIDDALQKSKIVFFGKVVHKYDPASKVAEEISVLRYLKGNGPNYVYLWNPAEGEELSTVELPSTGISPGVRHLFFIRKGRYGLVAHECDSFIANSALESVVKRRILLNSLMKE
jgi:hypothetical protein